jgi:hypothetical protein
LVFSCEIMIAILQRWVSKSGGQTAKTATESEGRWKVEREESRESGESEESGKSGKQVERFDFDSESHEHEKSKRAGTQRRKNPTFLK